MATGSGYQAERPPELTVTAGELAEHGLHRHPSAAGICLPTGDIVICRHHVNTPTFGQVLRRIAPPDAVLMILRSIPTGSRCLTCELAKSEVAGP
jgi:hypothetical protein